MKDPLLRLLACGGYTEGWGTYAEIYSYRFDNGLSPELSELLAHNQAATLGLYALLDININYEGWSQERTAKFLEELYSITDSQVVEEIYYAVADNPANYLQYYTGYMEMVKCGKRPWKPWGIVTIPSSSTNLFWIWTEPPSASWNPTLKHGCSPAERSKAANGH